jgi:Thioesterase superfamily
MSIARPSEVPGALETSDARRTAAELLRMLGIAFLSHDVDDETMRRLAAGFRAATETLSIGPQRVRSFAEITREPEADEVPDGGELGHFDGCFVTGEASPVGLAASTRRDGAGLVATVRFTRTFEGMPGFAHGGILLAVFDDLIGLTIGRLLRISAPTVRVEVDFRRPVPLGSDVHFRTRLVSEDGRVHAEAQALLIVLPADHSIGA